MDLFKKRRTALTVLALAVVFSVLFGSYRSLSALRRDAAVVFAQGEKGDGLSIDHDLSQRVQLANNLITVAGRYFDANDPLLANVQTAGEALSAAGSPSEKFDANTELDTAFWALSGAMEGQSLSQQDAKYRARLGDDFRSRDATISHDAYNRLAAEFNEKTLGVFPANVLGAATGVKPLELYR